MKKDDQICAICKHQKLILTSTFCGNPLQKDSKLRSSTKHNTTCDLFDERSQDFYKVGTPIKFKNN